MPQTRHTPGPWFVHHGSKGPEVHSNPDEGDSPVADISASENVNAEQDAALIAAAPEMLEALRAVHSTYRTFRDVPQSEQAWTSIDEDAIKGVEQAIHKATGR